MMLNFIFMFCSQFFACISLKFSFKMLCFKFFFFITEDTGSIHAGNLWKIICQSTITIEVNVINESPF